MNTIEHLVHNGDGWRLSLFQTSDGARLDRARRPVLIVPGYGMNSFIFSYHPHGLSLEGYLASRGFEVWRVDLRAQGGSKPIGRATHDYRLEDLAMTDLGAAIDAVLARTRCGASHVDVVGCSLGGTIMFVHAVLRPAHRIATMVAVGSPVRWVSIHPLLKLAFGSPALVGLVRMRHTRALVRRLLPSLVRFTPSLLSVYMNASITDTAATSEMVRTVEDPNRHINREIALWIANKDLVIRGVNISDGLAGVTQPLLCVAANGDGIVPRATAEFPYLRVGSREKRLLEVGTDTIAMAHADLFISNEAHERVFDPIASWLEGDTSCS